MWKVIWSYNGRREGNEKFFAKNYAAQSFANYIIRKPWCSYTEVKFIEMEAE